MTEPSTVVLMATGHRRIDHPRRVSDAADAILARLAPNVVVISGGAEGADSIFAAAAIRAQVPLRLVYPNRYYHRNYRRAFQPPPPSELVAITFAVERPDADDWRERWNRERWWVDNFVRDTAMITMSSHTIAVTARHPNDVIGDRRGGTAHTLREVRKARGYAPILWIPDATDRAEEWVRLIPPSGRPAP